MLLRAIKRSSPLLTPLKTLRSKRLSHSSSTSADFFRSSPAASTSAATCTSTSAAYSRPSDLPVRPLPSRTRNPTARKVLGVLKFGVFSAVAAALGTAGYATYAYTVDEVDEKTKTLRSSINHELVGTAPTVEKLQQILYTSVMTVSSKTIDLYLDLRRATEAHVQEMAEPFSDKLLPDMDQQYEQLGLMTLVLDLRGTLIHNEWKRETGWSTYKRPGLDSFLQHMSQIYEIVIYCDEQVIDERLARKLGEKGVNHLLHRVATKYQDGKHYRDLSKLNRDPSKIIYISGHALENCLQPENCVQIKPWQKEADDTTLIDLIPFLEYVGSYKPDIRPVLASYQGKDIPSQFIERSKRVLQKQKPNTRRRSWS